MNVSVPVDPTEFRRAVRRRFGRDMIAALEDFVREKDMRSFERVQVLLMETSREILEGDPDGWNGVCDGPVPIEYEFFAVCSELRDHWWHDLPHETSFPETIPELLRGYRFDEEG